MHRRGKGGTASSTTLGQQLTDLTQRMDHLERAMLDISPEGSARVLDRMHELEEVTRKQCNELLQIMNHKNLQVEQTYLKAESLVTEAEATCMNLEQVLHRRGDRERQETTKVQNELREAIQAIDTQATAAVVELVEVREEVRSNMQQIEDKFREVRAVLDAAEAAAAEARVMADKACQRQFAEWASPQELKDAVCSRARSVEPGSQGVAWIINMAQEAAARSPRRAAARSASTRALRAVHEVRGVRRHEVREASRGRSPVHRQQHQQASAGSSQGQAGGLPRVDVRGGRGKEGETRQCPCCGSTWRWSDSDNDYDTTTGWCTICDVDLWGQG